jgi:glycosyltransferase involved in cell wall biosynthesis
VYVPGNSTSEFADAVVRLLADPSKREEMGRIGVERINGELHWDRSVEQMLTAYKTVLE